MALSFILETGVQALVHELAESLSGRAELSEDSELVDPDSVKEILAMKATADRFKTGRSRELQLPNVANRILPTPSSL
jgi:hypothetical protein